MQNPDCRVRVIFHLDNGRGEAYCSTVHNYSGLKGFKQVFCTVWAFNYSVQLNAFSGSQPRALLTLQILAYDQRSACGAMLLVAL